MNKLFVSDERESILSDVALEASQILKKKGGEKEVDSNSLYFMVCDSLEASQQARNYELHEDYEQCRDSLMETAARALLAVESLDRRQGEQ